MSTFIRAAKIASLTLIALAFAVVNAHQSGPVDHGERHDHDSNPFTADIVLNNMCHHGWSCNGYEEWVAGYDAFPNHNRRRNVVPVKTESVETVAPKLVSNIRTSDTPVCPLPKSPNFYCNRNVPVKTVTTILKMNKSVTIGTWRNTTSARTSKGTIAARPTKNRSPASAAANAPPAGRA